MSSLAGARALSFQARVWIVLGIVIAVAVIALFLPAIAQDPAYHEFADRRPWLGMPNCGDVASNLPFLLVGLLAIPFFSRRADGATAGSDPLWWPFAVYFFGVFLVAFGSAYYHWAPTNGTLFWDRLPMSIAFMGLMSAFIVDRIHVRAGLVLLPFLIVLGVFSVIYWHVTEQAGNGDLRLYGVVQFFPMLAIPLICFLFPPGKLDFRYVIAMAVFYGLAKVFEHFDRQVFELLGQTVSGHTLKHLAAAVAAYMALPMLRNPIRASD